ncbi:MAG: DUF5685 family protein [Clostridia bacterium]
MGSEGRLRLTYDMTFLIMLLTSLYEPEPVEEYHRCAAHPTMTHWMIMNGYTRYAADMNVAMAYHHLMDDWRDEGKVMSRSAAMALGGAYKKIEARYPMKMRAIEKNLARLHELEGRKSGNLDEVSACFGRIMELLLVYKRDHWEPYLRRVGFYLGKYIYLLDAWDDLEEDKRNKAYNPLLYCQQQPVTRERMQNDLLSTIALCAQEAERLPPVQDAQILRNILYSGVWTRFEQKKRNSKNPVDRL